MTRKGTEPTSKPKERTFLVGVDIFDRNRLFSCEDSLSELAVLAGTAGLEVTGQIIQKARKINPKTIIGSGKLQEVKSLIWETNTDTLLFDLELSPRHLKELEKFFDYEIKIIDRAMLILDIFAQHAHTHEGALQVELAQYEYRLPRLTRAWTHLARQTGGGGGRTGSAGGVGLRGPGETQLEVDRREIRRRISELKKKIGKVRTHRNLYRSRRRQSQIPTIALVGYTNAGKSTLLNKLSNADVYIADKLFATLDPTTRKIRLPGGHEILMTDTVGFIQKLPTELIAAFRATLEEITEADLLLHIIDTHHHDALAQAETVFETLKDINANHLPVLTVLNKIDLIDDERIIYQLKNEYPNSIEISAARGLGIETLLEQIENVLFETYIPIKVKLPYSEGALISLFHQVGQIDQLEHRFKDTIIKGKIPGRVLGRYKKFTYHEKN